ncbi:GNAT family N-acetyltransferase [Desulfoluna butyratoxydans]|uniref:GNAT family N-acetyltransferase n=1 Tax=Desulfoluna butyratoxydans TaxID=231438 RepID=UPI0015D249FB|nr:GNAT family N-acetyltransferase [Desulfoluna butyratoxydans]
MAEDIKIEFIEDNRHLFSIIEESYKKEWKEYYRPGGQGDALSDIYSFCNKDKLPICLVALKHGKFLGSVALRQKSGSHYQLSPWVTSLYVIAEERQKGIGTKLIDAIENLSVDLGFSKIYSRSATATAFFIQNDWVPIDQIEKQNLTIFKKDIKP